MPSHPTSWVQVATVLCDIKEIPSANAIVKIFGKTCIAYLPTTFKNFMDIGDNFPGFSSVFRDDGSAMELVALP